MDLRFRRSHRRQRPPRRSPDQCRHFSRRHQRNGADTVFEMEIGTNRPDAMNHYGVAREAAAIYDLPLKPHGHREGHCFSRAIKLAKNAALAAEVSFPITVEEPQLCPRFSARVIREHKDQAIPGERRPSSATSRSAPNLERGRCHQLRSVGDRKAHPRLRRRSARRRSNHCPESSRRARR